MFLYLLLFGETPRPSLKTIADKNFEPSYMSPTVCSLSKRKPFVDYTNIPMPKPAPESKQEKQNRLQEKKRSNNEQKKEELNETQNALNKNVSFQEAYSHSPERKQAKQTNLQKATRSNDEQQKKFEELEAVLLLQHADALSKRIRMALKKASCDQEKQDVPGSNHQLQQKFETLKGVRYDANCRIKNCSNQCLIKMIEESKAFDAKHNHECSEETQLLIEEANRRKLS